MIIYYHFNVLISNRDDYAKNLFFQWVNGSWKLSLATRFGSILWRRSKNISIVKRWDAPFWDRPHSGHPLPLRTCAGVISHSCPHLKNLNLVFSSAFAYRPVMITSSLWDFKSFTNSEWDFSLTPAHLGQPWPCNSSFR